MVDKFVSVILDKDVSISLRIRMVTDLIYPRFSVAKNSLLICIIITPKTSKAFLICQQIFHKRHLHRTFSRVFA